MSTAAKQKGAITRARRGISPSHGMSTSCAYFFEVSLSTYLRGRIERVSEHAMPRSVKGVSHSNGKHKSCIFFLEVNLLTYLRGLVKRVPEHAITRSRTSSSQSFGIMHILHIPAQDELVDIPEKSRQEEAKATHKRKYTAASSSGTIHDSNHIIKERYLHTIMRCWKE